LHSIFLSTFSLSIVFPSKFIEEFFWGIQFTYLFSLLFLWCHAWYDWIMRLYFVKPDCFHQYWEVLEQVVNCLSTFVLPDRLTCQLTNMVLLVVTICLSLAFRWLLDFSECQCLLILTMLDVTVRDSKLDIKCYHAIGVFEWFALAGLYLWMIEEGAVNVISFFLLVWEFCLWMFDWECDLSCDELFLSYG
jgi:hypothetical protein